MKNQDQKKLLNAGWTIIRCIEDRTRARTWRLQEKTPFRHSWKDVGEGFLTKGSLNTTLTCRLANEKTVCIKYP